MLNNGVKETTATAGTGTVTLAAVTGFARFADGFSNGSLASYAIRDGNNWEWGVGTVGAANTLARTTITGSLVAGTFTTGGTAITLASGAASVFVADHTGTTRPASAIVNLSGTNTGDQTSIVGITGTIAQFNTAITDGDLATGGGTATGTNTGDQTITLTGGVTGSGTGSFAATVVTNANLTGGVTSVGNAATVVTNANLTGGVTSVGNAATVITNANLTGDVTSVGNATTLTNAPVIAKVLTGYVSGAGTVAATDSILQAIQKLNGNDTGGTVTAVSVATANGVSGSSSGGATPALTITLGAITPSAVQVSGLTASQILSTDASKNLTSLAVATYPSLTELTYVKGVTSAIQTQINSKGAGTVTSVAALTLGTTGTDLSSTVATGTTTPVITLQVPTASAANRGALSAADWSTFNNKGSGTVTAVSVATANGVSGSSSGGATPALTIALGAITPSTVNGNTITTGTGTLTLATGKTLTANNSITLAGTDATVMTFPTTSATIARTDAANTFTGVQTMTSPALTTPAIGAATGSSVTLTGTTPQVVLGANVTTLGSVKMFGNTSGDATVRPAAVAGTSTTVTLPNASSTLPIYPQQITYTGPLAARTITLPDANFTVARTDAAQTFTGVQTFTAPILGTPTSGTVTNLTGTASININGTVGATTPTTVAGTTGVFGSATSLLVGTAGSAVGSVGFRNATSGTATIAPPTGALGTYQVTMPNAASTLPIFGQQITFTGPTAARTITLPDAAFTVARTDAANTFTGVQTMTSPNFTTPVLGTVTSGVISACTSSGMVITSPSISGAVMTTMASTVITRGTAVASTSGTSIEFTALPSWIRRITIMFTEVSTNGTDNMLIRLGTGAGPTYVIAGYNSFSLGMGNTAVNGEESTVGFIMAVTPIASSLYGGSYTLTNITGNTWCGNGCYVSSTATPAAGCASYSGGSIALGAVLTAVRVTTVAGTNTFDSGSINIIYE